MTSAIVTLVYLPWTWSGGGGPPGNRYFLSAYPLVLFLVPAGISIAPGLLAWVGGALFTVKMLVSPFWAAKFPYLVTEKGPARRLPVELTMANDLPVRLAQPLRAPIQYRNDPGVKLYFLDQNAWPPEPTASTPTAAHLQHVGFGLRPRRNHRPLGVAHRATGGRSGVADPHSADGQRRCRRR